MEFILSDESVNSYGYRVSTAGIDISRFLQNPVCLWMHDRDSPPVGHWTNVRKSDGKLLADLVLDEGEQDLVRKIDNGHIRATSIGFTVDDVMMMADGTPVVTRSTLLEASLVTVPANGNAVKLEVGQVLTLSMNFQTAQATIRNTMEVETLKGVISAKDAEINTLKAELAAKEAELQRIIGELAELKAAQAKINAAALVDSAIADKKILATQREAYLKLAEADYDTVKALFDGMTGYKPVAAQLAAAPATDERAAWTLEDWQRKDPAGLAKLKAENGGKYPERLLQTLKTIK